MSNTTHQRPRGRNDVRWVLLAFIIVAAICFFSIKDEPLWIIIACIFGVIILFSSVIFKEFANDNKFAFNLSIELVAVILGIYLGINANDLAIEKGEQKQLLKIVKTTKTDLEECINKLTFEETKS